jgi:hypothetical protein
MREITGISIKSITLTVRVGAIGGAAALAAVDGEHRGEVMKQYVGIQTLISARASLPHVGWIFVENDFDRDSADSLFAGNFFVPENEDDEFYGEDNLTTWLESPTFKDILEVREKTIAAPTLEQYGAAILHYLREDDFLD